LYDFYPFLAVGVHYGITYKDTTLFLMASFPDKLSKPVPGRQILLDFLLQQETMMW